MSKTYCYEEVPLQENPEGFNIDDFVLIPTPKGSHCCDMCVTEKNSELCWLLPACSKYDGPTGVDRNYHFVLK